MNRINEESRVIPPREENNAQYMEELRLERDQLRKDLVECRERVNAMNAEAGERPFYRDLLNQAENASEEWDSNGENQPPYIAPSPRRDRICYPQVIITPIFHEVN